MALENPVGLGKLFGCFTHYISDNCRVVRDANRSLESRITHHSLIMCWGKTFAPLGAATFEHELAAFGAHAHTEAMSLGAPAVVGLKSPLHGLHLSINISAEKGKAIGRIGCCQGAEKVPE